MTLSWLPLIRRIQDWLLLEIKAQHFALGTVREKRFISARTTLESYREALDYGRYTLRKPYPSQSPEPQIEREEST